MAFTLPAGITSTVLVSEALPPVPLTSAVYVVVAVGVTVCFPPVADKVINGAIGAGDSHLC